MIIPGSENYPIYVNPTDSELIALAESKWDTLRVLEWKEGIVIASGYGNTHNTLVVYYRQHFNIKRYHDPDWDTFIFFYQWNSNVMLCNLGDVGGPERAKPATWKKYISDEHARMLEDIAQYSGLVSC